MWQYREEGVALFIKLMPDALNIAQQDNSLSQFNSAVLAALIEILKDKV
jgi:hypothetical protein